MNYYEHHLGDYLRDTAHLSMLEDGAYRRLLDAYYIREQPLPLQPRDVFRLVRASSKQDREAVETVLREFFTEGPDGWFHSRCHREIERFQDKQRKAKASAEARWANRPQQTERNANAYADGHANASPNAMRTHSEGNAPRARPQTPDTRHQTPDTSDAPTPLRSVGAHTPSLRSGSPGVENAPPAPRAKRAASEPPVTAATWDAYSDAYRIRYAVDPVRNAKVNGQLAQLVQRLGADEAPGVAGFFVGHQRLEYVRAMHPVDLLLRDAEALRTSWATGRQVTATQAQMADRTQTNANAFAPLLAEARAREAHHQEAGHDA